VFGVKVQPPPDTWVVVASAADGCVMVAVTFTLFWAMSNTVTVYVPALKPEKTPLVWLFELGCSWYK
jgi:hypothetical protein